MNPVIVNVMRGGIVESLHRGAVAILDASGGVVVSLGDVERAVFPRSAVKLLQALPLVSSGAAEQLGLSDAELALACASHSGEAAHTATAAAMLAKAGFDATALECGIHWPYSDSASRELAAQRVQPSALHNNCSGKHAGFLCLASALHGRADRHRYIRGYVQPGHPLMREVSAALQACTGWDLVRAPRGIDGCGMPTYAVPLRQLALAFARVGTGAGLSIELGRAASRLRAAVARSPFMVAGTGRFDTRVMEQLGDRLYCKVGAEGVYCAALPQLGFGVALKVDDGNNARACEVAMAAVIEEFVPMNGSSAQLLRSLSEVTLKSWAGAETGKLQATPLLRATLGARARD
jgi:L-asparaginase II